LNSTSQGPTPEDAREDAHIRGRSRPFMKYAGYLLFYRFFLSLSIANVLLGWNFISHFQSRFPGEGGHYTHESKVFRHRQDPALSRPQRDFRFESLVPRRKECMNLNLKS
jgi:hypothetical protein